MNPILVETPAQRAARENANLVIDFILSHLHWWPYFLAGLAFGVAWGIIWRRS